MLKAGIKVVKLGPGFEDKAIKQLSENMVGNIN